MSMFDNLTKKVTDKVTETAKAVSKKSNEIVEVTKLNIGLSAEEEKIEKVYAEIGKMVSESFEKGETIDETYMEQCEKIKSIKENITSMQRKILEFKNVKKCSACGEELDNEIAFCPKCGAKQEVTIVEPEVEKEKEIICPECNTTNEIDAAFCTKCGAKLG